MLKYLVEWVAQQLVQLPMPQIRSTRHSWSTLYTYYWNHMNPQSAKLLSINAYPQSQKLPKGSHSEWVGFLSDLDYLQLMCSRLGLMQHLRLHIRGQSLGSSLYISQKFDLGKFINWLLVLQVWVHLTPFEFRPRSPNNQKCLYSARSQTLTTQWGQIYASKGNPIAFVK